MTSHRRIPVAVFRLWSLAWKVAYRAASRTFETRVHGNPACYRAASRTFETRVHGNPA